MRIPVRFSVAEAFAFRIIMNAIIRTLLHCNVEPKNAIVNYVL